MQPVVLVVEDDCDLRECLCGLFEREGYTAVGKNNGREALAYLGANQPPCLILLDLMMPEMNGWEFLSTRKTDEKLSNVPVAVLSAVSDQNVMGLEGASVILQKPITVEAVLGVLRAFGRVGN